MPRRRRICLTAGIIFGLALSSALQIAAAAESKRVLLLYYSFGGNLVNAIHFRAALEQQSQELLEIYDAPLNTARPANEDVVARYVDYLHALLPDQRLDLVVAVGASAVSLSQRYRRQNFPFTPKLAVAEERRIPLADLRENDVVVPIKIDLAGVIANILPSAPTHDECGGGGRQFPDPAILAGTNAHCVRAVRRPCVLCLFQWIFHLMKC